MRNKKRRRKVSKRGSEGSWLAQGETRRHGRGTGPFPSQDRQERESRSAHSPQLFRPCAVLFFFLLFFSLFALSTTTTALSLSLTHTPTLPLSPTLAFPRQQDTPTSTLPPWHAHAARQCHRRRLMGPSSWPPSRLALLRPCCPECRPLQLELTAGSRPEPDNLQSPSGSAALGVSLDQCSPSPEQSSTDLCLGHHEPKAGSRTHHEGSRVGLPLP